MPDESADKKKLYIDEDWKAQVEAEKEAAARDAPPGEKEPAPEARWPEPSLPLLATTLATQSMAAMGFIPHPVTGKAVLDLPQARHFIDTIAMLQQKTEGNRSPEESKMLEETLHELRMAFVAVRDRGEETGEEIRED